MQEFRSSQVHMMRYYYDMGLRCRLHDSTGFWSREEALEFIAHKNDPVEDPEELRYADVYCTVL